MDINVIASGSCGNCYIVSDGESKIMLECGIPMKAIQKGADYDISDVDACLLSHHHADHALAYADIVKAGIDLYMHPMTANELNVSGYGLHEVVARQQFTVGTFAVIPFDCVHYNSDGSECACLGYLIFSMATQEKLMFATDTAYIHNRFNGLDYIMLEVNYIDDFMQDEAIPEVEKRRFRSHMSLNTAVEFLKQQDLSGVKQIYALHLSKDRCDADAVKKALRRATGKEVII